MIKPLGNRILVEQDAAEDKTKAGIYIPETAKEKPRYGTVIATGEGVNGIMPVKIGDRVVLAKGSGQEVEDDGKTYLLIRDVFDEIMAIV